MRDAFFPFSPFSRGEGRDEGRRQLSTFMYADAPHVVLEARLWRGPLPARGARGLRLRARDGPYRLTTP